MYSLWQEQSRIISLVCARNMIEAGEVHQSELESLVQKYSRLDPKDLSAVLTETYNIKAKRLFRQVN